MVNGMVVSRMGEARLTSGPIPFHQVKKLKEERKPAKVRGAESGAERDGQRCAITSKASRMRREVGSPASALAMS